MDYTEKIENKNDKKLRMRVSYCLSNIYFILKSCM